MTNKTKKTIRAHAQKTGMSYQAAFNALKGAEPAPAVLEPSLPDGGPRVRVNVSPEEESRLARNAVLSMTSHATAFIAAVDDPRAIGVGSGTLLLTPRGRPTILTCSHFLRDWERLVLKLGWDRCRDAQRLTEVPRAYHLDDALGEVDVAILIPPPALSDVLRRLARPHTQIGSTSSLVPYDDVSISGFPWDYRRPNDAQHAVGFSSFSVGGIQRHGTDFNEAGLAVFEWVEPTWPMSNIDPNPARFQPSGPARDPSGMSGGGVWRYKPLASESEAMWSPSQQVELIGVQRSWDPRTNRIAVEPVERWSAWVRNTLQLIDDEGR